MEEDKRKPIAVVMTAYNAMPVIDIAIKTLLYSTQYPLKLIIIESASDDGTVELCDKYAKKDKRIKVIHNKEREEVTKAVNAGIKEAGDMDVLLTHCDVIYPRKYASDWLAEMVFVSQHFKDCGVVTCYGGGNVSGPDYLDKFPYTGTWCMLLPRKTINKIGLFDEETFAGPGDDIDYSYRIKLAGLKTYVINYWVDHHQLHTWRNKNHEIKYNPIQKANGQLFKKKWGLK